MNNDQNRPAVLQKLGSN